jgi:hypothetical protein
LKDIFSSRSGAGWPGGVAESKGISNPIRQALFVATNADGDDTPSLGRKKDRESDRNTGATDKVEEYYAQGKQPKSQHPIVSSPRTDARRRQDPRKDLAFPRLGSRPNPPSSRARRRT